MKAHYHSTEVINLEGDPRLPAMLARAINEHDVKLRVVGLCISQ
jgi:hypothetical protein